MDRGLDGNGIALKPKTPGFRILFAIPPVIFLAVFYFYPLASIFRLSFMPDGVWDVTGIKKLLTAPFYAKTLWFTTWQAAFSTLLTIAAALPGAWVFAKYRFPGKSMLHAFTTVPFVLPTVVVAAAFQALLGHNGIVNACFMKWLDLSSPPIKIDRTIWFILLAHVFYNYTIVLRIVGGFWSRLDPKLEEAARMLGASPLRVFVTVTLPLLQPAIMASGLLIFIFCFSSFGIVLILGGPGFATLEVEIYRHAVHLFNLPMSAALSLAQIVFTFALMWVYTAIQRRTAIALNPTSAAKNQSWPATIRDKLIVVSNTGFMILLLGAPPAALIFSSVDTGGGVSFDYYRALFENRFGSVFFIPPIEAIAYSAGFAGAALLMALPLGALAAIYLSGPKTRVSGFLDPVFMLPLSTSAVTLGFGFILALDKPPLNLRTSLALVPLAHTLVAFPFVVRSLLPALRSIPGSLREAAAVLGASPFRAWRLVDLPIVWRALLVGGVFAFTISLGEFGATVFTARPHTPTMPIAIYRFLGQPGELNHGQAMAMSSLLMLVTASACFILERFRVGDSGEF